MKTAIFQKIAFYYLFKCKAFFQESVFSKIIIIIAFLNSGDFGGSLGVQKTN